MPNYLYLTDLGNAQRLVALHGVSLRFCPAWRRWLVWDGTRWRTDETAEIMRRAKDVILEIYRQASQIADDQLREALIRHGRDTEELKNLRAMIALAESEPGIPVRPEELDRNPWLLNCANGTLDLRNGKLRAQNRRHLITKLVPVHYEPRSGCPLWDGFLKRITNGNLELMGFLKRAVGYSLTGLTIEQVLFILFGLGANGKTTFLETLTEMLGEYAMHTPTETLLVRRGDAIPNDVARLKGARMVVAMETEDGRRLASARVKQLTGGDTVTARFMRAEFFEFRPEFKLFLAVNHRPVITDTTDSIWRRIPLIPFEVKIPMDEQDKNLQAKLRAERSGILAWAVEGCLEWQRDGLGVPSVVTAATEAYRLEMDATGRFLAESCVEGPNAKVQASLLYSTYKSWCWDGHESQLSMKKFGEAMKERGLVSRRSGPSGEVEWQGISVV